MIKYLESFWSFFDLARIIDGEAAILTIALNDIRWILTENEIHPQQEKEPTKAERTKRETFFMETIVFSDYLLVCNHSFA
jgi:hypothetical protein